ncbi:rhodanese-like domain-containing protein [Neolewinella aurantiaca]|uniref:Rhodanese-like domain-containing protein n=1 Tax=Neolewinella aurantiaca TaxID=2602767 RepID=A0A5C7FBG6_9BACT|nr:rhodanese-like domain-containing protein [Neolewinella aurantiaca]TXF88208.1 rhodanese-like domain-containing protein [Neolewinella aurantiaca]
MKFLLPLLLLTLLCTCGPAPEKATSQDTAAAPAPAYQDISPAEFAGRIGGKNTILIDVRTPAETAGGIIEGAIEIDYRSPDFEQKISELDPDKTFLVYCASGGRSGKACEKLSELGASKLYNLKGGYAAWKE